MRIRHEPLSASRISGFVSTMAVGGLVLLGGCYDDPVRPFVDPQDRILFLRHADGNEVPIWYSRATDIFRMNADGSEVVNLTNHPAQYISLSLAPDGRRVTFSSDRSPASHIWVMDLEGAVSQLTHQHSNHAPRWSPDGARIAFLRSGPDGEHVYVMNANGSDQRNVSLPAVAAGEACPSSSDTRTRISLIGWFPDGRVAFSRYFCGEGYRFYTVHADGSGFSESEFDLNHFYWSPDGSRVAFIRNDGSYARLFVMNADGSGVRRLSDAGTHHYLPPRTLPSVRTDYTPWSSDGSRLVFYVDTSAAYVVGGDGCSGSGEAAPHVVNVDGSGLQRLTEFCGEFNGWAPGNDRVAFTSTRSGVRNVHVVNADGTGLVNLTGSSTPESSALWLPAR